MKQIIKTSFAINIKRKDLTLTTADWNEVDFISFFPVFSTGKIYFNNKCINDIILKTDAIKADKSDDALLVPSARILTKTKISNSNNSKRNAEKERTHNKLSERE